MSQLPIGMGTPNAFRTAMTQLTGKSKGDDLQQMLQMMGMGQSEAALRAAVYDQSRGDLAGFQKNLTEAFTGIDPGRMSQMMPSQSMCSPSAAMGMSAERIDLKKLQSGSAGGALLGGIGGWALGGPIGGLLGGLLGNSLGKRMKAKCLEKRLNRDPMFRAQFESAVGGEYVPDGRNDGKISIVRRNFGLPGFGGGVFGSMGGNLVAGSALSGLAKMMGNAAGMMGAMGFQGGGAFGLNSGQMSYGGFDTNATLSKSFGTNATAGGPGSRMANLPPNATFEDLVSAFMMDTLKDMQDEAKEQMDKLKKSNETQGGTAGGGMGGMLGGLGQIGGGMLGGMLGGQGGSALGGQLGGALGGALGGGGQAGGKQGEDSRQLMFEELKNTMQKIQQMFQSLSNVINTMHQGAMNSIRNIKA